MPKFRLIPSMVICGWLNEVAEFMSKEYQGAHSQWELKLSRD
jgi:hypothetical protein